MGINKKKVLGVDITIDSKEDILENIKKYLDKSASWRTKIKDNKKKPFIIFTPNPEIITYAQKDEKFKEIVNSSQINIPDGMGVVWALKKLHKLDVKRLSGVDLMLNLCQMAEKGRLTIGLIGGKGGVALETRECLLEKYPKLKIEVFEEPEVIINQESRIRNNNSYFLIHNSKGKQIDNRKYFKTLIEMIKRKQIDILFVGLGFPKQEFFINILNSYFLIHNSTPIVMMGVGGTFGYLAGRARRAPEWMRKAGLEWLYRLIREPWRLFRQIAGAKFFYDILFRT